MSKSSDSRVLKLVTTLSRLALQRIQEAERRSLAGQSEESRVLKVIGKNSTSGLWFSAAGNLSSLPRIPCASTSRGHVAPLLRSHALCLDGSSTRRPPRRAHCKRLRLLLDCQRRLHQPGCLREQLPTVLRRPLRIRWLQFCRMPGHLRFQLRQLQPLVPHPARGRTILHPRPRGSSEGSDHAVRGKLHHDAWRVLLPVPLNVAGHEVDGFCKDL